ncbi:MULTISPECIES: hypothetical protein [unclassified Pseudoclavibacter]|uniref:hypothetical protein n=1 Tax=unclassified Pseudoclavibacter TaxID=2615177 RepID=UPI001BABC6E2|nr:hypothetical protein [Pseudoclavibacter sp. Marseille-Q4354]MBS3177718.1 hypothetical protein [Pseudoclavibacter sp. Marseille-Q4354]
MSYVDSPAHGAVQLVFILAILVLALHVRQTLRTRAALRVALAESGPLHTTPLGEPAQFRPGVWVVRLSSSEAVFGRSRDEVMERAFQPRQIGLTA